MRKNCLSAIILKVGYFLLYFAALIIFSSACNNPEAATPPPDETTPDSTPEPTLEPTAEPTVPPTPSPTPTPAGVSLDALDFPKAFFRPGEAASWTVTLVTDTPADVVITSKVLFLDQILAEEEQTLSLQPGEWPTEFSWQPPPETPRGYGLDITVASVEGELLLKQSAAFDVLDVWTQHPRYGFMTNFPPDRDNGEQALDILLRYHINGLQFYDWMYEHAIYLPPQDIYQDPRGRDISLTTIVNLIEDAHERNMAAMAYTTVYAASQEFFREHEAWALYKADGQPADFEGGFLMIMDPRPGTPWTNHLLDQFSQILAETPFDGIHLDQFGWPKEGYDNEGNFFALDQPLADLIDSTAAVVTAARGTSGTTIFNAVTNWPINTVAPAGQNVVYIEVWEPYTAFNDFYWLINQAQELGSGKPVVIAAYIDPRMEVNARLNDAVILGSGAGHIELGENGRYLTKPYFPDYRIPSPELAATLRRYYEFAIRYQNVMGPAVNAGGTSAAENVSINGLDTSPRTPTDKVLPIVRESAGYTAVNFVNLLGLEEGLWAKDVGQPPTILENAAVTISEVEQEAVNVWVASPDQTDFTLQPLEFQQTNSDLTFTLPSLSYWTMILVEWSQ